MKIKSFIAIMIAGILCVTSLASCNKDEDENLYYYRIGVELTDPGDMSESDIATTKANFAAAEATLSSIIGAQSLTPSQAASIFNDTVDAQEADWAATPNPYKQEIKVTFTLYNKSKNTTEITRVIVRQPQA